MNISGKWKGIYTYGQGYVPSLIGKSEPFEFDLKDDHGIITGTCIDEVVNFAEGNEAQIVGTFNQKEISFKKRYKIELSIDDNGQLLPDEDVQADGVDYEGIYYKGCWWRKPYFKGMECKGIRKNRRWRSNTF